MSKCWKSTIEGWFNQTHGGGLVLPDGWFGRPYDNIHQLTFVQDRPNWLVIELDERLLLTIRDPMVVEDQVSELVIEGFSSFVFDWKEYGSKRGHVRHFESGRVALVAPPGFSSLSSKAPDP